MRFSKKSIYAIRATFDLAYHGGASPVQLRDVAERQDIPIKFLEQIFGELKRDGLVTSKRGPKGGYTLTAETGTTTLAVILSALGELPELPEPNPSIVDAVCTELVGDFVDQLQSVTLEDLIKRGDDAGLARECYEEFVYVI